MKKTVTRSTRRISLPGAATLLVMTTLVGQILGFLRTMLVNANFDDTGAHGTDAYFAAFKIPDFFFYTLAAGALGVAFIPILTERLQRSDRKGVWALSNSLMNLMAIIMFAVGVVTLITAPQLMNFIASDLQPEQLSKATTILRIIAFNPLLFTLSGIITSVQQTFGRFFFFAVAPIVYNMSIIASIFLFKDSLGLVGLGVGALLGAILQFFVALSGLYGLNFHYRPSIDFKNNDFWRILRQLPSRALDQGIDSVNSIVETNRAQKIGGGLVTYYENAFTLHTAPILLIGSSISTAAFPRLTERLAQGRTDLFRKEFIDILRVLIWLSMPAVIISYFCRGYLARLIFKRGAPEIALILGFLSIAILFRVMYTLLSRYFYAHKDTVTPLIVSIFAIFLNIILAFALARPEAYGAAGLAIAQSIVSGSEVAVLFVVIMLRDRQLFTRDFWDAMTKLVSITGFTIVSAFIMITLFPLELSDRGFFVLSFKLGTIVFVTLFTHVAVSALFGFKEAYSVAAKIKKLVLLPVRIQ